MDAIKSLFKGDPYIWGIYLLLLIISIVESFSATSFLAFRSAEHYTPAMSHVTHLIFGCITVLVLLNIRPHIFRVIGGFAFPASIILLVAVLFTAKVNDASRYIFGFQPSELAKFALVSVVSSILAKGQTSEGVTLSAYKRIIYCTAAICGLIFTENFSTAALLAAVIFFLMFIGRVQLMRLAKLVAVCSLLLGLFVGSLLVLPDSMMVARMDTWKQRIVRSSDDIPKVDQPLNDKNLQVQYGHMAIANGGIVGKGPGQSQIRDFLPLAFSDFIYSIILEEGGLVAGFLMIFLYLFLLIRAAMIFLRCENIFQAFFLLGLAMLVTFQALTNMAVGVDLIPVTGQPLPLLSRGGSSILMTSAYFGIIQSISRCVMENEQKLLQEQMIYEGEMEEEESDLDLEGEDELLDNYDNDSLDMDLDMDEEDYSNYEDDETGVEEEENEFKKY